MKYQQNMNRSHSPLIADIQIRELFGRYNYNLRIPRRDKGAISRIGLIYGDNGTGKTTILTVLYHLLSTADNRGHRGQLTRIPFSAFLVKFADGTRIRVVRDKPNLIGAYVLYLTKKNRTVLSARVAPDESGKVESLPAAGYRILREIASRSLAVYFLRDDRMLESDEFPPGDSRSSYEELRYRVGKKIYRHGQTLRRETTLQFSLERMTFWLQRQLIRAASKGEVDAQHIYAEIVDTINRRGVLRIRDFAAERELLIGKIKEIDKRSRSFTKFGLTHRVNPNRFVKVLNAVSKKAFPSVAQVVSSYIDGQEAKLNALDELNKSLHRFVELINGFLLHKSISLEVDSGISIKTATGSQLNAEKLSSGEKQLLLLFCNVLMSTESASLFIIDEPEISLNVKWQRKLIDALAEITSRNPCQFLLATHSIEILARHRDQVIKLKPN